MLTINGWTARFELTIEIKKTKWTQSIPGGSRVFIEKMKEALGFKAKGRKITSAVNTFELQEVIKPYGKVKDLDWRNTFLWNQQA